MEGIQSGAIYRIQHENELTLADNLEREEKTMLIVSLIVFAIAALGGATLAVMRIKKGENPPLPIALVHGAAAAIGLIALIIAVVSGHPAEKPFIALVIFAVAAVGGFVLFGIHLGKKLLPVPLVLIHAVVAVIAFFVLLLSATAKA